MGETIREILSNVTQAEDDDIAFIIAAAINLYSESQRRLNKKVLFGVNDVRKLISVINLLIAQPEPEPDLKRTRPLKLTQEEEDNVISGLEEIARPRRV